MTEKSWVLIKGLGHEHAHWLGFADKVKERFAGDAVVTPDLIGSGAHHQERPPLRLEEITERMRADVAQAAKPPYILLSISMGSMVAYDWAKTAPEEVAGIVLINTSFAGLSPFYHRLRWQIWPQFLRTVFSRKPITAERRLLPLISQVKEQYEEHAQKYAEIRRLRPVAPINVVRQMAAAARYRVDTAPPVPCLVLSSEGDILVDPACSKKIAEVWHAEHRIHPWAGHNLPMDDPEWVLQQVEEWMSALLQ